MSVGAWLYATGSSLAYVTGNNYASGAAILIAVGIFTALLCGLGVIAALCKNRPLLGLVSERRNIVAQNVLKCALRWKPTFIL